MTASDLFRSYKRHYHKVAALVRESPMSFGLKLSFADQTLRAENSFPDDAQCARLCILMRPFLSEASSLSIDRVWSVLKEEFAAELVGLNIQEIDEGRAQSKRGSISIVINNEPLTAEGIYADISAADLFDDEEAARRRLAELMNQPPAGHLLWSQFYSYTTDGFYFASFLFDVVKSVENSGAYKKRFPEKATANGPCIYCLSSDGPFTSEEHPMPEGLGNDSAVLPPGIVCDKCNSGVLAVLDKRLLNSPVIAFMRVLNVQHTKDGKLPTANFQNAFVERTGPRHFRVTPKDKSAEPTDKHRLEDGALSLNMTFQGHFDPVEFARSLYKIALGMVAFKNGAELARSARYDRAREFIRKGGTFPNNLLMSTTCKPHHQIETNHWIFPKGTPFAIDFFGIVFLFNLEPEPVLQLHEQIEQHFPGMKFVLHSLMHNKNRRPRREKGYGTSPQDPAQS